MKISSSHILSNDAYISNDNDTTAAEIGDDFDGGDINATTTTTIINEATNTDGATTNTYNYECRRKDFEYNNNFPSTTVNDNEEQDIAAPSAVTEIERQEKEVIKDTKRNYDKYNVNDNTDNDKDFVNVTNNNKNSATEFLKEKSKMPLEVNAVVNWGLLNAT